MVIIIDSLLSRYLPIIISIPYVIIVHYQSIVIILINLPIDPLLS